jgi:hypothetical protein
LVMRGPEGIGRARSNHETKGNQSMHAVIRHYITDPAKWNQSVEKIMSMIQNQQLPSGILPLQYLPSADGRNADCVWQAESLGALQKFVDGATSGARNEYFAVKEEGAVGLPKGEEAVAAPGA